MAVIARHATPRDLAAVESLCEVESHILEKHWGPYSLPRLLERSALSCCAVDDKGTVVGFACFHHFPTLGDFTSATWIEDVQQYWKTEGMQDLNASNSTCLSFFFAEHIYEEQVLNAILKMAMVIFTEVERVLLFLPTAVPLFKPLIGNFEPLALQDPDIEDLNVGAYVASRTDFMGQLVVRNAMVEDHDDLVPIFRAQKEDAEEYGEFFLAQMIQQQDAHNKALVAESGGRAVGLLALTADVELGALQESFELEPYDFFVQGYAEEALRVHQNHIDRTARLKAEHAEKIAEAKEDARKHIEEEFEQYLQDRAQEEEEEAEGQDDGKTPEEKEEEAKAKQDADQAELERLIAEAEEEAIAEIGDFHEEEEPEVDLASLPSNAICVTLFCLDPQFDCQVQKLLGPAFDLFPDQEYCLITVPHSARHMSIMRLFLPVREKLGCNFSHALYICHRASLITPIFVQPGTPVDIDEVTEFLSEEEDPEVFLSLLRDDSKASEIFITRVLGQVVAVAHATISKEPGMYPKYYELEEFIDPSHYGADEHTELKAIVVNPIFNMAVQEIIRQIQCQTGTCCTYALLHPSLSFPDSLQSMTFMRVRRQQASVFPKDIDPAKTGLSHDIPMPDGPPTLLHTNFRLLCQPKRHIDTRIVVVGGSYAAMGFLESLVAVPYLNFHRLTVVTPGGLASRFPLYTKDRLNYSEKELLWHGVSGQCNVVNGSMVALNREDQSITLQTDDGNEIEMMYDHLVLAPGLRDTVIDKLGLGAPIDGVFSPCNQLQEEELKRYVENEVRGRADVRCVVYGSTLDTLITANALTQQGVQPRQIQIICPDAEYQPISDPRACSLALLQCELQGIKVQTGQTLAGVESRQQRITHLTFEGGQTMACGLLVAYGKKAVDPTLFFALNDQSLVFDGKLVVDASFKTNDPKILAGGNIVKFARRIQDPRKLEQYNLRELGQQLGAALLVDVDPEAAAQGRAPLGRVPPLTSPLGEGGALPGGLHYVRVFASPALFPTGDIDSDTSRDLVTEEADPQSYARLLIDKYGRVSSLCFLSSVPLPEAWNFKNLVGLPVTYLNDIVNRCDLGLIMDIRKFLLEDWAKALFHDRFGELRRQLESAAQTSEHMAALVQNLWEKVKDGDPVATEVGISEASLPGEAKIITQDGLNNFLEMNGSHLPVYLSATRASDMQTNNIWSQTAEKVGLVVGDVPSMDDTL